MKNLAQGYIDALADVPTLLIALDQDVYGWIDGQPTGRLTVPRRSDRPARVSPTALRKLAPKPTTAAALRGRWSVRADSIVGGFQATMRRQMGGLHVRITAEGTEPYTQWRWRWRIERTKGRGSAVFADQGDLTEGASWPAVCSYVLRKALELEKSVCALENATRRGASTAPARAALEATTPTEPTKTAPVAVAAAPVGQRRVSREAPPTTAPQRALFGAPPSAPPAPSAPPVQRSRADDIEASAAASNAESASDRRIQVLEQVVQGYEDRDRPVWLYDVIDDAMRILRREDPTYNEEALGRTLERQALEDADLVRWNRTAAGNPAVGLMRNRDGDVQKVLIAARGRSRQNLPLTKADLARLQRGMIGAGAAQKAVDTAVLFGALHDRDTDEKGQKVYRWNFGK